MKTLVRKMKSLGILKVQMVIGAIVMIAAMVGLPISIITTDASLMLDPYVLGVVLVGALMFAAFAYGLFIRPYLIYRKLPEVLVEADDEYLYIHGKKEAKIALSELDGAGVFVHLPFIYSNELIAVLIVHLFSEKYGDLDLDIPGYGSYKLRFVSDVQATSNKLIAFMNNALNND